MASAYAWPTHHVRPLRAQGAQLIESMRPKPLSGFRSIDFKNLEYHRIVGTGQFGLVRVVRNTQTNEVYALKVRGCGRAGVRQRACARALGWGTLPACLTAPALRPGATPQVCPPWRKCAHRGPRATLPWVRQPPRRTSPAPAGQPRPQIMHKAPIVESKQIEHVLNERKILQEATHPFCVKLCGAYQDRNSLYLLQVRGGRARARVRVRGVCARRSRGGAAAAATRAPHARSRARARRSGCPGASCSTTWTLRARLTSPRPCSLRPACCCRWRWAARGHWGGRH